MSSVFQVTFPGVSYFIPLVSDLISWLSHPHWSCILSSTAIWLIWMDMFICSVKTQMIYWLVSDTYWYRYLCSLFHLAYWQIHSSKPPTGTACFSTCTHTTHIRVWSGDFILSDWICHEFVMAVKYRSHRFLPLPLFTLYFMNCDERRQIFILAHSPWKYFWWFVICFLKSNSSLLCLATALIKGSFLVVKHCLIWCQNDSISGFLS